MSAFYAATVELGLQDSVTTFTLSDFGRTLSPRARRLGRHRPRLGQPPVRHGRRGRRRQLLRHADRQRADLPDAHVGGAGRHLDTDDGRGRWIPTTGVEQYGATLAKWFGVSDLDMGSVFPNIGNFPTMDLGFMGSPPAGLLKSLRPGAAHGRPLFSGPTAADETQTRASPLALLLSP